MSVKQILLGFLPWVAVSAISTRVVGAETTAQVTR